MKPVKRWMSDWYRKCERCGQSWHAHNDHQHTAVCPFRDCGDFVEPTTEASASAGEQS